jgi:hypothetical protein
MIRGALKRAITEAVIRPTKKPVWYAVHALTGIRIQMTTRYLDAMMFAASFRAPMERIRKVLPSPRLIPVEVSPGFAAVFIGANEFRHVDVLYPYNEVAMAIPIYLNLGNKGPQVPAMWYLHLPVSTEDGRWGGVENYGFPKFVAEIRINSDFPECRLLHKGREILTLKVRRVETSLQEWDINNVTMKDGKLIRSTFSIRGQRGIDETAGGGSLTYGDHPIAAEMDQLQVELSSFRHEYCPKVEATLEPGRELRIK